VVALLKANGQVELFKHLAHWRTRFGVEMDITPAISDAEVVGNHKVLFAEMDDELLFLNNHEFSTGLRFISGRA